jgi:organic hydroperoxide reductase OsmC/OhrA
MHAETSETGKETGPEQFSLTIDQIRNFEFRVKFDKEQYLDLMMDEPHPIGDDKAPNASRLLAAAVGNCLSASFLFSARKVRADLRSLQTTVKVWNRRNEKGRLRIGTIKVEIAPTFDAADGAKIERCIGLFEDYCVVTQSVRNGIDVVVEVQS